MRGMPIEPVRWRPGRVAVLDQTRLPQHELWVELQGADAAAAAIRALTVRGAPVIGIVAGYAVALEAARGTGAAFAAACDRLRGARPTAVNLAWAVDRVQAVAERDGADAAAAEAVALHAEQDAAAAAIGEHGADVLPDARRILTHCNAGALACAGEGGTALSVVLALARRGDVEVLVSETRPLLQGARLTCWELDRHEIPHALCVDGAAAGLVARGEVDAVVVGCDRVAANGDVANKVGTYAHALAAHAAGIPFVVAGPRSTVDPATPDGAAIEIEERAPAEVAGTAAPAGTPVRNPAFDVTPARLVTALVTEAGVAAPPDRASIARLLARSPEAARR